ncbi:hypothetical protein ABZ379_31785 [Streptomyces canus]|uniref:hypothetical protein n=1 Tax=Streptomyces canus TaxID=58343 RepID=UPI0033FDF123
MTTEAAAANAWLKEIGARARTSTARVFSVSVPLNHPSSPDQAPVGELAQRARDERG